MHMRSSRLRVLAFFAAVGVFVCVLPAFAFAYVYHTDGRESATLTANPIACDDCHGLGGSTEWDGGGPHRGFTQYTRKCVLCHAVHDAAAGAPVLLRTVTITDTCETCHDNTGAVGVYSSIQARGASVGSSHSVDATSFVPGGSTALSSNLGCLSCHSVHSSTDVQPFLRDTGRALASKEYVYSNCLLRDDVGGKPDGTYTTYGGAWCASCHDQRTSSGPTHSHPTTEAGAYELGRDNVGYLMAAAPDRLAPYCQQCHEDSRDVETGFSASMKNYGYSEPDTPTNPPFVTFPHQTVNASMTVETGDDLCDNCHDYTQLP
jgi:hypothetical protein